MTGQTSLLEIQDRTEPGPTKFRKSRTEPRQNQQELEHLGLDQDHEKFENFGPSRTGPWILSRVHEDRDCLILHPYKYESIFIFLRILLMLFLNEKVRTS